MNDNGQTDGTEHLFDAFPVPSKEQWKEQVVTDLKGAEFGKLAWKTYEGISVEPMYVRADIKNIPHLGSLPGFDPYVRGTGSLGHAGKSWVIAQATSAALPEDAASEIVHARRNGQDGAAMRMDTAAILGSGSDEASLRAGASGVSVQHLPDFQRISERLQPDFPLDIHAGMSSPIFLAMAAVTERSVSHVDFNPLAHLIGTGTLPYSMDSTFTLMRDAVRYVDHRSMPTTVISVCGECYHDAGANAVQELACMMASGVEYLNRLTDLGLTADAVARRVRFNVPVGMSFFMEIAKLRAARMLWARVTSDFGVREDDARKIRVHVRTSLWHQTKYDPYVNMLRSTIESMAAIIGGMDSMYTAPFDEVASTPGAFSKRVARNLQIVLREESRLGHVADPAAGSYYIETLTHSLAEQAWQMFQEIEKLGGYLAAVKSGFIQDSIGKTAAEKRANISRRRDVIVGSNQYPNLGETALNNENVDTAAISRRLDESLRLHLDARKSDPAVLSQSLKEVLRSGSGNLIAAMAAVLQEGLTVAEINDVLRNGGTDAPHVRPMRPFRAAEEFERLRDAVVAAENKPCIFLATYGPGFWRRARATFSSGFFGAAGLNTIDNDAFETPEAAAAAALEVGAHVVVACSDDESYTDMVPRLIAALRGAGSDALVIVAGYPKESVEALEKSGVDQFIHVKSDAGAVLGDLLKRLGIGWEEGKAVKK
jgi:methylmalonyl-CoA mutase